MGERVHVVVAAGAVDHVRVPPLSIVDGSPDVEWVEVPVSRLQPWGKRMRVPLDPASAKRNRRWARTFPLTLVLLVIALAFWTTNFLVAGYPVLGLGAETWWALRSGTQLGFLVWVVIRNRWLIGQRPARVAGHLIRFSGIPKAVAQQWAELNPESVRVLDRWVVLRRYRPRAYVISALACAVAGTGLWTLLANDGRENDLFLWLASLVLLIGALVLAFKSLPRRYIRFEPVE
ncbi:hypothetical protein ACQP2E_14870 [Actinoplanes sp. CA-015351]|uniref:hypothetical protein n=1 Tax=Actinoplanes sp. CA-015351 TaxID=3239897 RepID=UPI003D993785